MKVLLSDEVTETNQKRRNLKDWGRGEKKKLLAQGNKATQLWLLLLPYRKGILGLRLGTVGSAVRGSVCPNTILRLK